MSSEALIELEQIEFIGAGLKRPECVLATADGVLHLSNWDGGISRITAEGRVEHRLAGDAAVAVKPNGICLLEDGSYLLAHLGDSAGGVYRLHRDGRLGEFLLDLDGETLPPTNYVHLDNRGRIWITVSTRLVPRARGYRPSVADGFILLVDGARARIVADDLGYTNECVVDPGGEFLYVNETFARRTSRFAIRPDHSLGPRETVAEYGAGSFPDGLVFDREGGFWITSIISNRVIRVLPGGEQQTWVEDVDADKLVEIEAAFVAGELGRPQLDNAFSRRLKNISSLAFGGPDLKRAYLGCLLGDRVASLPLPVAGHPPAHWNFV